MSTGRHTEVVKICCETKTSALSLPEKIAARFNNGAHRKLCLIKCDCGQITHHIHNVFGVLPNKND